ncbi:hypothetical protein H9Q74_014557, partial [Fusarium xylarioides]
SLNLTALKPAGEPCSSAGPDLPLATHFKHYSVDPCSIPQFNHPTRFDTTPSRCLSEEACNQPKITGHIRQDATKK